MIIVLNFALCRKIQTESATGSVSVNKVRTTLTIKIEAIDFDTQGCVLRLKGRNIQENQYVKVRLSDLFHLKAFFVYFSKFLQALDMPYIDFICLKMND